MGGGVGSWDRMIEVTEVSHVKWGFVLAGMGKEEREIAST